MKTYQPKQKDVIRSWHQLDADNRILGRLATEAAVLLMGKHKNSYSAHMDSGDYVVVVNAEKIQVSGKKEAQKVYQKHSGYPGGFKEVSYAKMKEQPIRIIEHAIRGMLPNNRLLKNRMNRLKVIVGNRHPFPVKADRKGEQNAS